MSRQGEKRRVVYRHPLGRYEVTETTGVNIMGDTYHIREAELTPERDARGLLTNADKRAVGNYATRNDPITEDEKKKICKMYVSGRTVVQVAGEFCRSYDAINNVLKEKDIRQSEKKGRKWTTTERQTVALMYMEHHDVADIAAAVGRSMSAVSNVLATMRRREEI